ncbi:MAG: hypothetical protein DCO96_09670 [Fluviicola sp. XM-24bin1]|nr:MAG: hypothetical protein DCO96_09670 [Fluviicola sp. XM-24bin1]
MFLNSQTIFQKYFSAGPMKSSKTVRITIIITLIIITLFIVCYYWFIRPIYLNNLDQNRTVSLKKEQAVAFGKYADQGEVFGIELEITGNASSNVDIILSDTEGVKHIAGVKGKNLEFTYKNDWYSDSCFIELIPRDSKGGKVDINCRFLALE